MIGILKPVVTTATVAATTEEVKKTTVQIVMNWKERRHDTSSRSAEAGCGLSNPAKCVQLTDDETTIMRKVPAGRICGNDEKGSCLILTREWMRLIDFGLVFRNQHD